MAKTLYLLLLQFLLYFSIPSFSISEFTSISCGSKGSFVDERNLTWVGDDQYIHTGETKTLSNLKSVDRVLSSLRIFPNNKKNCFNIPIKHGVRNLVRAMFYYGNYDSKSSPPSFDLQFDSNKWASVDASEEPEIHEVIYVPRKDTLSVCVYRTKDAHVPFITSIEVRELDWNMYDDVDQDHYLILKGRYDFGGSKTTRFPDDPFDRIWVPATIEGKLNVTSNILLSSTKEFIKNQPPPLVLKTACASSKPSETISLSPPLSSEEVPSYIILYFSEITQLKQSEIRSFNVTIDGVQHFLPIIPPYQGAMYVSMANQNASKRTQIDLIATGDSTLPPLVNAMEVFVVGGPLANGTSSSDVAALSLLQREFEQLREWSGDPCLPASSSWDWVACSSSVPPRITALCLGNLGLKGSIPNFSALDSLQIIDMQNNSLEGQIPDFLGSLPKLTKLNLGNNNFSGSLPTSLSKNKNIKLLDVSGNPRLSCTPAQSCSIYSGDRDKSSGVQSTNGSQMLEKRLGLLTRISVFLLCLSILNVEVVFSRNL